MKADSLRLHDIWAMLVAGWADRLDPTGANLICDGVRNDREAFGSYEGTTRMMWGLGGWLSCPARPSRVRFRNQEYDIRELTQQALLAGTNPDSRGYWGDPESSGTTQPTVESAQVAYAIWQSRRTIWDSLPANQQDQIARWLRLCGRTSHYEWKNNWALFWALNHTVRKALGLDFDQGIIIDVMYRYLDDVYCGNGWYDDGATRGANRFDDYNFWVFASHVLAWSEVDCNADPERVAELLDRVRQLMAHYPYFFAADGAYPEYGRSGAYKFARLGAPIWAYRHGIWPHSVGLLKTIVYRHMMWYVSHGAIRADGTLRQSLTSTGSNAIREPYISTGAPYWAMQAFGGLWSLPDDDPFWSAKQEPLPIERESFSIVLPQPGWIVTGSKASGHVHRYPAHGRCHASQKYAKFVYSTAAPYNAARAEGMFLPDAMIGIAHGASITHREAARSPELHEDGWIRYGHDHQFGAQTATFETIIIPDGDLQLRIHRLVAAFPDQQIATIEGAAALGYDDGEELLTVFEPGNRISAAAASNRVVGIRSWDARSAKHAKPFGEAGSGNIVFGRSVIPHVAGSISINEYAIATVFLGNIRQVSSHEVSTLLSDSPHLDTIDPVRLLVNWRGRSWSIPVSDSDIRP
ncbi:MAG TPA: DUF2264 domain-containing protein [Thermomicrobiales bacterium]|nr:DUF2264 domain-containing protein [Thermomicrobiales bacterium]